MSDFKLKLKLIYLPYLLISIGFISLYTFFHWLLIIKLKLISPDENLVNLWLPIAMPWMPLLMWLRPRTKLLIIKNTNRSDWPTFYIFIAAIFIIGSTLVAQSWMVTATGKLTTLDDITHVKDQPLTKYYKLKHYFIDKKHSLFSRRAETSGRYNQHLKFYLYVVCPVLVAADTATTKLKDSADRPVAVNGAADTSVKAKVNLAPAAWLGIRYALQISSHLSDAERQNQFEHFFEEKDKGLDTASLQNFVYLDRIGNNENRTGYLKAIKTFAGAKNNNPIIFEPVTQPFEARNGKKAQLTLGLAIAGPIIWLIMISIPGLKRLDAEQLLVVNEG
jgi:hypothetical protein